MKTSSKISLFIYTIPQFILMLSIIAASLHLENKSIFIFIAILSVGLFTLTGISGFKYLILFTIMFIVASFWIRNNGYLLFIFLMILISTIIGFGINYSIVGSIELAKLMKKLKRHNYYQYIDPMDKMKIDELKEALKIYLNEESPTDKIGKAAVVLECVDKQKLLDLQSSLKIEKGKVERNLISKVSGLITILGSITSILNELNIFNPFEPFRKSVAPIFKLPIIKMIIDAVLSLSPYMLVGIGIYSITMFYLNNRKGEFVGATLEIVENALGRKKSD